MPAVYAHDYFGKTVISYLPPSLQEIIQKYPKALHLGFQGPDILFYYKPLRKNEVKQLGVDIHHTPANGFFIDQAKRLSALPSLDCVDTAYLVGFLCHYLLDISLHPLVYEVEDTGVAHGKIESEFDKFMLRKNGKPIRGFNTAKHLSKAENTDEACARTLGVQPKQIQSAIRALRGYNWLFSQKCEGLHTVMHAILKLLGMDDKFGEMFLHKKDDERCKDCCVKLAEALEQSVPFAVTIISNYFARLKEIADSERMDEPFHLNYTGGNTHD